MQVLALVALVSFIGIQVAIIMVAQAHDPAWKARQSR